MRSFASLRPAAARIALLAVSVLAVPQSAVAQSGRLDTLSIASPALADNLLGEPGEAEVAVYTPPGYESSGVRYPVLYLLHGIAGSFRDWTEGGYQGLRIHTELDSLIAEGAVPPMIVVMPTGRNRYLGAYYSNSPVTGRWADFIADELVGWTDERYRTIARPGGRGLAGHSMGGFGALSLPVSHPGVFSAVYGMAPCCLDLTEDFGRTNPAWKRVLTAAGPEIVESAARDRDLYTLAVLGWLSVTLPEPDRPPFFVGLPYEIDPQGFLLKREPEFSRFRAAFLNDRVDEHVPTLMALRGIAFDVGRNDQFPHILPGAAAFSSILAELEVPHSFELYTGDHRVRIRERLHTRVLPFFASLLDPATPDE